MSRTYNPDRWVIIEMNNKGKKVQKVLAGWQGGYLDGDSWKLSSGTLETEEDDDYYIFKQHSGSVYKCNKSAEGFTLLTSSMLSDWQEQIKELEDVTVEVIQKTVEEDSDNQ